MNFCIQLTVLLGSTVHVRFFIIGTFPVAFSSTQTKNNKHIKSEQCKEDWGSLLLVASLSVGVIDVMDVDAAAWASSVSAILLEC